MGLSQTGWGRLGRDIEIQYSQSGFAFGKTGVACKIPKKNPDGTYGATEWVELTFLGKAAENAASMLQKGSKVWFIGYPQTEEWDDKQNPGQKRKQTRVVVQQWEALDPNPNAQGGQGGYQQGNQQQGFGQQNQNFNNPQGGFNPNQPGNQNQGFGGFNPNQPGNQNQGFGGNQQNPTGPGQGFGQGNQQNQGGNQFNPQGTGDDVPF